jgi:hypothetical protein
LAGGRTETVLAVRQLPCLFSRMERQIANMVSYTPGPALRDFADHQKGNEMGLIILIILLVLLFGGGGYGYSRYGYGGGIGIGGILLILLIVYVLFGYGRF